jgi:hypothetical protein
MVTTPSRARTNNFSCPDSAEVRSQPLDELAALFEAYLGRRSRRLFRK